MQEIIISKEQARQFAYDLYDIIVQNIKECEVEETNKSNNQIVK